MSLVSTHRCKNADGKFETIRYFTSVLPEEQQHGYETVTDDDAMMDLVNSYKGLIDIEELDVPKPVLEHLYGIQQAVYNEADIPEPIPEALALTVGCPINLNELATYVGVWADIDDFGGGEAGFLLPLYKARYNNLPSLKSMAAKVVKQEGDLDFDTMSDDEVNRHLPLSLAREMGVKKN